MRIDLHPEARAEFRSATLWYEERRDGLGDEFVAAVTATLRRISEGPVAFSVWPGTRQTAPLIRKAAVERFPYAIAFEQHERRALVLAVAQPRAASEATAVLLARPREPRTLCGARHRDIAPLFVGSPTGGKH